MNIRNNINKNAISDDIVNKITAWDKYDHARHVMLFYPVNSEVSLLKLLSDKDKSFYFPVIRSDKIFPVKFNNEKGFCEGKFKIQEPIGELISDFSCLDLIFLPALAADKSGGRLGYGKGFYDRFLTNAYIGCVKAVPLPSELFFEGIPTEPHDKSCDFVITEKTIFDVKFKTLND